MITLKIIYSFILNFVTFIKTNECQTKTKNMLSINELSSIQAEIEKKYNVKMHPSRSTFQMNLIDFYAEKRRLSDKQVECIKNPKYPIKGI